MFHYLIPLLNLTSTLLSQMCRITLEKWGNGNCTKPTWPQVEGSHKYLLFSSFKLLLEIKRKCAERHIHTPFSLIVRFLPWNLINCFFHSHVSPRTRSRSGSWNTKVWNRSVHISLTQERKLLPEKKHFQPVLSTALLGPGDLDTVDRDNFLCCDREQNSSAGWDHRYV